METDEKEWVKYCLDTDRVAGAFSGTFTLVALSLVFIVEQLRGIPN